MAVLVVGVGFGLTACSDDDDDNKGGGESTEVGGGTVNELGLSDDETVLAALVQRWCDVEPEAIKPGILNQTFEPTVGFANGNVRSMVVETQAAADDYAVSALSALNINPQQPAGFSWSGGIGTVSYNHGSGNELGVINVSIKQIPHLQKIRLLKDAEDNAPKNNGLPYYQKGDIVKYTGSGKLNGKYFICLNDHNQGQEGNWITFDDPTEASIGTCNWTLTGKDSVYNDDMASLNSLYVWLKEFILNKTQYSQVYAHMTGNNGVGNLTDLVPGNDGLRKQLIRSLIRTSDQVVTDAWEPLTKGGSDIQAVKAGWKAETMKEKSSYVVEKYAPYGMILGTMRWSMGTTYHYWQPYLSLVKDSEMNTKLQKRLNETPSQGTLSKSHFQWSSYPEIVIDESTGMDQEYYGQYQLVNAAVHWTHDAFKISGENKEHYGLLSFVRVKGNDKTIWKNINLTSHELVVKDKGEVYKYFETVYRRQESKVLELKDAFCYGDVLTDAEGGRWFCIRSSADVLSQKDRALFVSFDNITTYNNNDLSANNIVTKDEVYAAAYYLNFMNFLLYYKNEVHEPVITSSISEFAGVNPRKLYIKRDSTVHITVDNQTHSFCYSIAYNDGTTNRQPVMRVVQDATRMLQGDRTGQQDAYLRHRYYNHYQKWNGGGKAEWEGDWTMTTQPMYLDDVANQQLVNQYATDKWTKLPKTEGSGVSGTRTAADPNGAKVSRYLWKNGAFADPTALNMYNEPVLFLRLMWVKDKSTVSDDGRQLTVTNLIERNVGLIVAYNWWADYNDVYSLYSFVDNKKLSPYVLTK